MNGQKRLYKKIYKKQLKSIADQNTYSFAKYSYGHLFFCSEVINRWRENMSRLQTDPKNSYLALFTKSIISFKDKPFCLSK